MSVFDNDLRKEKKARERNGSFLHQVNHLMEKGGYPGVTARINDDIHKKNPDVALSNGTLGDLKIRGKNKEPSLINLEFISQAYSAERFFDEKTKGGKPAISVENAKRLFKHSVEYSGKPKESVVGWAFSGKHRWSFELYPSKGIGFMIDIERFRDVYAKRPNILLGGKLYVTHTDTRGGRYHTVYGLVPVWRALDEEIIRAEGWKT